MTLFSRDTADAEVVAVDGLFFAIRRDLFDRIHFDDALFDGFHFYDLDISMQVRLSHRILVTWDIVVKHYSEGSFDQRWKRYATRFVLKWSDHLPATCTDLTPSVNPDSRAKGENFDLKGKLPQTIIVE
jgi:GT2 family glycosyltransferase